MYVLRYTHVNKHIHDVPIVIRDLNRCISIVHLELSPRRGAASRFFNHFARERILKSSSAILLDIKREPQLGHA